MSDRVERHTSYGEGAELLSQYRELVAELARSYDLDAGLEEVTLVEHRNRLVAAMRADADLDLGLAAITGELPAKQRQTDPPPPDVGEMEENFAALQSQEKPVAGDVSGDSSPENLDPHECTTLSGPDHAGQNLQGVSYRGAELDEANFAAANLDNADFVEVTLVGACFRGASMRGAHLDRANLLRADLAGADLTLARLSGANFAGADLRRADLQGAAFEIEDLDGARWDDTTLWSPAVRATLRGESVEVAPGVFEVQREPPQPTGARLRGR